MTRSRTIRKKSILPRGNSTCKGPEVAFQGPEEASVAGMGGVQSRRGGES